MRIRKAQNIRIRMRIRIPNTEYNTLSRKQIKKTHIWRRWTPYNPCDKKCNLIIPNSYIFKKNAEFYADFKFVDADF